MVALVHGFPLRDHPRICGEHAETWIQSSLPQGSSPHMRGTRRTCAIRWYLRGIIPAYAGNTYCRTLKSYLLRDHPRICGEHRSESHEGQRRQGSSPHMRGTHADRKSKVYVQGIIPAYAGNTSGLFSGAIAGGDHPRICGEHSVRKDSRHLTWGSSPHMRGTH